MHTIKIQKDRADGEGYSRILQNNKKGKGEIQKNFNHKKSSYFSKTVPHL